MYFMAMLRDGWPIKKAYEEAIALTLERLE
jgi:hypothetical protein